MSVVTATVLGGPHHGETWHHTGMTLPMFVMPKKGRYALSEATINGEFVGLRYEVLAVGYRSRGHIEYVAYWVHPESQLEPTPLERLAGEGVVLASWSGERMPGWAWPIDPFDPRYGWTSP